MQPNLLVSLILGDLSSTNFEVEFYDNSVHLLLSRKGYISRLPVNIKLIESDGQYTFDYTFSDAKEMTNTQNNF